MQHEQWRQFVTLRGDVDDEEPMAPDVVALAPRGPRLHRVHAHEDQFPTPPENVLTCDNTSVRCHIVPVLPRGR